MSPPGAPIRRPARLKGSGIWLASPCPALPAPILKRQSERPMPDSVENSICASLSPAATLSSSCQRRIAGSMDQASDAPKPSISCRSCVTSSLITVTGSARTGAAISSSGKSKSRTRVFQSKKKPMLTPIATEKVMHCWITSPMKHLPLALFCYRRPQIVMQLTNA